MIGNLAIVVVSRLGPGAKSRLRDVLSPSDRMALARAMLLDVLATCLSAGVARQVLAVVDDPEHRLRLGSPDVELLADPHAGLNAAIEAGLRRAEERHLDAALVLPSDVPLVTRADLLALVAAAASEERCVAVARDRGRTGTNGLLLRPPSAIAPSFGTDSASRHATAARAAGAAAVVLDLPGLALDVDTPGDFACLCDRGVGGRTAKLLERLALGSRPGELTRRR